MKATEIFIYDEFHPEDTAMMQALYSRSGESAKVHADKVKARGSGNFMASYYVGYGHGSIGDCGSTTIYIEGVSMLVAKAVQDWPLYSGQETSSRYIDMSKQGMVDPLGTKASKAVLDAWMNFYTESQPELEEHLRMKYPRKADEDEKVYDKAIKARIFDILRAFLPAGAKTQLSWHTNLRQAHDHLALMKYYPLDEVRAVAGEIEAKLKDRYPSSFSHKEYPEQEKYRRMVSEKYTFYLGDGVEYRARSTINKTKLMGFFGPVVTKRPTKTTLPHVLSELGSLSFQFLLDFGSFRDIQRHRNGVCRMPLLTTKFGFQEWYLDQLSPELQAKAQKLIKLQIKAIKALKASPFVAQYYIAMGFNVTCDVTYGLPAAVYTMELRSGRLVHPTLRAVAHKMYRSIKKFLPGIALHADLSLDDWDIRRGMNDIVERK
jgi:thymidylate synthase ThyX